MRFSASTCQSISELLLKRETIEREQFEALLQGATGERRAVAGPARRARATGAPGLGRA